MFSKILSFKKKEVLKPDTDNLKLTKNKFFSVFTDLFKSNKLNQEDIEEIREALLSCDIGYNTSEKIISKLSSLTKDVKEFDINLFMEIIKKSILEIFNQKNNNENKFKPNKIDVILIVGVNGVGKTTTIAKLANYHKKLDRNIVIGAGDTFRAAAIDQINLWGKKLDIPVVAQQYGSDPSAVVFNTINSAISKKNNLVIIDTSGRLHNNKLLMDELAKIKKTINKFEEQINLEIFLILDATIGQNALEQAKQFLASTSVSGLILTKMDGTAKGGVVISIVDQLDIPIKYICFGEKIDDIEVFNSSKFVENLFSSGNFVK